MPGTLAGTNRFSDVPGSPMPPARYPEALQPDAHPFHPPPVPVRPSSCGRGADPCGLARARPRRARGGEAGRRLGRDLGRGRRRHRGSDRPPPGAHGSRHRRLPLAGHHQLGEGGRRRQAVRVPEGDRRPGLHRPHLRHEPRRRARERPDGGRLPLREARRFRGRCHQGSAVLRRGRRPEARPPAPGARHRDERRTQPRRDDRMGAQVRDGGPRPHGRHAVRLHEPVRMARSLRGFPPPRPGRRSPVGGALGRVLSDAAGRGLGRPGLGRVAAQQHGSCGRHRRQRRPGRPGGRIAGAHRDPPPHGAGGRRRRRRHHGAGRLWLPHHVRAQRRPRPDDHADGAVPTRAPTSPDGAGTVRGRARPARSPRTATAP